MPVSPHRELYQYWDRTRDHRPMPTRSDIDPVDIPRILPYIGLVERRPEGYFWRLIGTAIVEHFGRNLTGERYGSHFSPSSFIDATVASFDAAFAQEVPIFDEFVYRLGEGLPHAVSRLLCPLAADRSHPPMIIHTRLHRYETLQSYHLVDRTTGEMHGRRPIFGTEDLDRQAKEWFARASAQATEETPQAVIAAYRGTRV